MAPQSPAAIAPTQAAEFDPQRAVWMAWPTYDHKKGASVSKTSAAIIRELQKHVQVELLVPSEAAAREVKALLGSRNLRLHRAGYNEIWMRDFGPSFLTDGHDISVADFDFNLWGYAQPSDSKARQHDALDRLAANARGVASRKVPLVGEGGNRESNGRGVLMLSEAVELQRNPKLTRDQIEERLRECLGATSVIWIPQGMAEDGYAFDGPIVGDVYLPVTTGGHVDNVARFVGPNVIALAEVTPEEAAGSALAKENRRRLELAREAIEAARDQAGKPFQIVRLPVPDLTVETMSSGDGVYEYLTTLEFKGKPFPKGKRIKIAHANSYMNFLITNGLVLGSKFARPGAPASLAAKDRQAELTLRKLFPRRKVVLLDTRPVNLGGGGIHCITAHEPRVR